MDNNNYCFNHEFYFIKDSFSNLLHSEYDCYTRSELESINLVVNISGRIISKRDMGKVIFINVKDFSGDIQVYVSCNNLINKDYFIYVKKNINLGDIIGVNGYLFKTKTNELTIYCKYLFLLKKIFKLFPDKFHGLVDKEICYRKRYLDLIFNKKSMDIFYIRSKILYTIRHFLFINGFIEVETPIIQFIPGGANAKPFSTYYNFFDMNVFLRISPELYLKRLIIGGYEKIFEMGKSFRNEGLSSEHNPEFTMLEIYVAYSNYFYLIEFLKKMLCYVYNSIYGFNYFIYGDYKFDFYNSFRIMTMIESIVNFNDDIFYDDLFSFDKVVKIVNKYNIEVDSCWGLGRIIFEIFEKTVKKKLIFPTFVTQYPTEVSILAKSNKLDSFFSDRFELFICGKEICNGFSELNDHIEQYDRFVNQFNNSSNLRKNKNYDLFLDIDYIDSLKYGMPPTSGMGIGIDRLVMLFTNSLNIKDVIFFPIIKYTNKF